MEKERNFMADQVKSYAFNKWTRIAADNGVWPTYPSPLE